MVAHDEPCLDADQPSGWDEETFAIFVGKHYWKPRHTMPSNPHEYTLRGDTGELNPAVRYIREHGENEILKAYDALLW